MRSTMVRLSLSVALAWLVFTMLVYLGLASLLIWYAMKTRDYFFVGIAAGLGACLVFTFFADDEDKDARRFCWVVAGWVFWCFGCDSPFSLAFGQPLLSPNGDTDRDILILSIIFLLNLSPVWYPNLRQIIPRLFRSSAYQI